MIPAKFDYVRAASAEEAISLATSGMRLREAAAEVAHRQGVSKNAVYDLALKMNPSRRG